MPGSVISLARSRPCRRLVVMSEKLTRCKSPMGVDSTPVSRWLKMSIVFKIELSICV